MKTEAEVVIDDSDIWEESHGLWVPSRKRHRAEFMELLGARPPKPEPPKPEPLKPVFVKLPLPEAPEPIVKIERCDPRIVTAASAEAPPKPDRRREAIEMLKDPPPSDKHEADVRMLIDGLHRRDVL